MKRFLPLTLCAMLVIMCLTGCVTVSLSPGGVAGEGDLESYTFTVGEITEIRVELLCNIEYYAAPSGTVTLALQPNLLEYITVEESRGVLTVSSARNIYWSNKTPVLTVSTPVLNRLHLAGAGTFTAHDPITADSFTLKLDGAASGKADLDVDRLSVSVSGAGDFALSGTADTADFSLAGAGTIDALPLQTRETSISLSGVGIVRISCSDNLKIDAGGMGSV